MSGRKITHRNFWNSFFRFAFLKTGFLIFENLRLGKRVFMKQKLFRLVWNSGIGFFKKCERRKMVPFFFCSFSASLSSWFLFFKIQRRKLADKKSSHRIFEIDFCDLLYEKIELADLDLLILKSRNDGTVIWKLDFKKLDLDGWMCVKPKWWIRKMGLWFLKIDGRKLWYLFSHVYFVGSFSRLFFRFLFFYFLF